MDFAAGIVVGFGIFALLWVARRLESMSANSKRPRGVASPIAAPEPSLRESLLGMAAALTGYYSQSAHPSDLLANEDFVAAVDRMEKEVTNSDDLLAYYNGD